MGHVVEREKRVPVVRDCDVAVAGAGVSGIMAALAAARQGASVVLIDRFGQVGGNMGPGYFMASLLYREPGRTLHVVDYPGTAREFVDRIEAMLREAGVEFNYPHYSFTISRLAQTMLDEAAVELMLSARAADPVIEGNTTRGLFVETKSGRVAVRAKVVVDATGDASIAARAGAPIVRGSTAEECDSPNIWEGYNTPQFRHRNDGGVYAILGGVDMDAYTKFAEEPCELNEAEAGFRDEDLKHFGAHWPDALVPLLHRAWESGGYRASRKLRGNYYVGFCVFRRISPDVAALWVHHFGDYDGGSWEDVSDLEAGVRAYVFDTLAFLRKHRVPGFENAFLLGMSAFLGSRGGPRIEGEYVLQTEELWTGMSHPDTMFRSYVGVFRKGSDEGCDMPYGMALPKGVTGLLVTGRGMSYHRRGHDPGVRARCNMIMLGECIGTAAALAAAGGVEPCDLDLHELRRILFERGYPYGDKARLRELGLVSDG